MDRYLAYFIIVNVILIVGVYYIVYIVENNDRKRKGKKKYSLKYFFNRGELTAKGILSGLVFGMVFGFIDNISLLGGMHHLEKYFPGGILTKSGLGNTYADTVASSLGIAISLIAKSLLQHDDNTQPIWLTPVATGIGCLIGLFSGRIILGRK